MVRTQKKRMLALAEKLESGENLSDEEKTYFAKTLKAIGNGEDANVALCVKYDQGRSESDEARRENLRLIFAWIMVAMRPEPLGLGLKITAALTQAAKLSQERGSVFKPIEYKSLSDAWYDLKNVHLKKATISPYDVDSPFRHGF